ncbi:hypothetical protein M501DRAFT_578857 [Patellaria atrata CBS 101060]|uniref:Uncharacterized protein n=1 Tax=Patellaria atrata CBS 101060 TaxID=1346257 RepID=A0A9P4VVF7_9PEZI|nr:hypothetical protein M501DRAFT_578857 [Patellaria atrata CBS 101060]
MAKAQLRLPTIWRSSPSCLATSSRRIPSLLDHQRLQQLCFSSRRCIYLAVHSNTYCKTLGLLSRNCKFSTDRNLNYYLQNRAFASSRSWHAENHTGKGPARDENSQHLSQAPPKRSLRARLSTLNAHENIYNIPNLLTFSRLLAAPAVGYLILHDQHVAAVSLFAYAGITDLIDGWMARKYHLQTVVGSVVDPMADKILMTVVVGCLAVQGTLPLWIATMIFGRDASLAIAAIYYRYTSLPEPKTLARYWDFSLPSAEVHPTTVSKLNTFLQLGLIGSTLTLPIFLQSPDLVSNLGLNVLDTVGGIEGLVKGLQYVVASTTAWSGLSYVWTNNAVTILGDDEALKRKQGVRGRAIIGVVYGAVLATAGWLYWREDAVGLDDVEELEKRIKAM